MKYILQQIVISFIALYLTMIFFPGGLIIKNGFSGLLYASVLVVLGFVVLRPLLNIVALPFNLITIGIFSVVSTIITFFLISLIDKDFSIHPFTFQGLNLIILNIPAFKLGIFLSYLVISVTIQFLYRLMIYIFDL